MANILLNLLSARSEWARLPAHQHFLNRIGKLSPHDNYIVLKDTEVLNDLVATEKLIIINK